ncbi:MAG: hypothetical protein OEZ65_01750 [Gemmatimonadota bacterium]|nr:hypothetical protein [Gemmatimonadota bacterium]MDH5758282.1 hypothetical protein [Gemmatimonadota bacterium]
MTEEAVRSGNGGAEVSPPLSDDLNPAIIDAHKTFIITLVSAALFIGAVFIFIL